MTHFIVSFKGAETVAAHLARIPAIALQAQIQEVRALGDGYVTALKDATPLGKGENPGQLRAGYSTDVQASSNGVSYRITNTTPHLRYVLNGRGAVYALHGKALRFVIGGRVFFRRSVGPAAANDFPSRVRTSQQRQIDATPGTIVNTIVRMYGGGA